MSWSFIRHNGYTKSEALKCAWANFKLMGALPKRICQFFYVKVSTGETRQAFGTLMPGRIAGTTCGTGRAKNDNVVNYYDTEKGDWRSFRKCNLIRFVA